MSRHQIACRTAAGVAAVLALALGSASTAAAQTGTINATATVLQPITVSAVNDLQFGNIYPGVDKAIAYTDASNAGMFSVAGDGGAQVSVSFTLPTDLNGPSGSTLPIASWDGYHNTTNSATTGGSNFTPSATAITTNLSGATGSSGSLYIFLGATVSPTATQTQGSYTNTVQMTVAYTGV
jgi:hypothetical protein